MADQLKTVILGLTRFTDQKMKRLILNIVTGLVDDTPHLTGWARNNWIPHIGKPPETEAAPSGDVSAATGARQAGVASIAASYTQDRGPVYISNNVPYILALNEGWSEKAPAGFVQDRIDEEVNAL